LILNIYIIFGEWHISCLRRFQSQKGAKKRWKKEKDGDHHLGDRCYGSFYRTFQLPADIVQEKAEATFKKGLLIISVPKAAESKTKKIEIKH